MSSIPATSQAWQVHPLSQSHHEYDAAILQNLVLKDIETPQPGPGEVLVRMRAVALNFRDLLVIADSPNYPGHTTPGLVPCSDGAGDIAHVGEGSQWKVGDRVILMPNHGWLEGGQENFKMDKGLGALEMQGTLSHYRVVEDKWLVSMPTNLSFEEAASLPTAGAPAMRALFHSGIIEEGSQDLSGKSVVVQGTGGVSIFALQLASATGAKVVATSSSVEKLHLAQGLGASDLINYNVAPDWADEVLEATGGKGVDLVVEVGGAGTIQQSLKATRFGGTVVTIGILTSSQQADLVPEILFGAKTVKGQLGTSRVILEEMVKLMEDRQISPVVGKTFDWKDAREAFHLMMKQGTVGKIVIRI